MPEENVDLVRRLLDAWNRRDLEAMLDLGAEDVTFVNSPTAVEPGTRRSRDEVSAAVLAQWETSTNGRFDVDRYFDRGDEIIALGRASAQMPGGDARIEQPFLGSYQFRDGKIVRVEILGLGKPEVEAALEAAGLRE